MYHDGALSELTRLTVLKNKDDLIKCSFILHVTATDLSLSVLIPLSHRFSVGYCNPMIRFDGIGVNIEAVYSRYQFTDDNVSLIMKCMHFPITLCVMFSSFRKEHNLQDNCFVFGIDWKRVANFGW